MAIRFNSNMVVAKKVLAAVNKKIAAEVAKDCYVEAYANCREQGYSIVSYHSDGHGLHTKRVCFSENRNSDNIVVYHGETRDFDISSNIPNDDTYRNSKFFSPGDYDEAAGFIVRFLSHRA